MSKLKFDYSEMRKTIPDLEGIINDLKILSSKIGYMDIPYFSYSNTLSTMRSDLQGSSREVDYVLDNIQNVNKLVDDYIETYSREAKTLPNYIIDKRDSIIKL